MKQQLASVHQGHADSPKRILYDMSFTCVSGKISGIERVGRSLYAAGIAWQQASTQQPSPLEFVPVFASDGRFYEYNERAQVLLMPTVDFERDCISSSPDWYRLIASSLCRVVRLPWLRRHLLPPAGHLGIFKTWHRKWKKNALANIAVGQPPIEPNSDDIVWLPDAYWAQPGVWSAADYARQQGALVASLVYDLIPLRSGGTINPRFHRYLHQLLNTSHVALCISDCERHQLQAFQAAYAAESSACRNFRTITLGCEIKHSQDKVRSQYELPFELTSKFPSKRPSDDTDGLPVYLCVNTFDPRKNHALILDAFDQLWAMGSNVRLCLVGRVGWQCNEILRRIAGHKLLNQRLFVFHDATDAEVNYCYQRARAVITASKDEGFGLPIVESLSRGRTTLASDIAIHREVGGQSCHYFASTNPAELARLVQQCESNQLPRSDSNCATVANRPKIQSWQQSFDQCRQELEAAFRQRSTRRMAA